MGSAQLQVWRLQGGKVCAAVTVHMAAGACAADDRRD